MGASQLTKHLETMSPVTTSAVVLVLASGRGERFKASGGLTHKLDAPFKGKTVLQATLDAVIATGLSYHLERANHAGMGDAIAAAVRATKGVPGWLILPADMPLIHPSTILAVAAALKDADVVLPIFEGKQGHPVGFSKNCLRSLLALTGDKGARALSTQFEAKRMSVDNLPYGEGCLIDIDTVEDLKRAQTLVGDLR
jgi:molybdenum cofactor cytidylyltransferase